MEDIKKVWLLYLKAFLLFLTGLISSLILVFFNFNLKTIVLLLLSIWGFCRAYYFAFYAIQHYIDPTFKYSGLMDFAIYQMKRRNKKTK